jgi:3-hydroxymyristoyl/3-hydroxydecanoyl-(acyl carrier protein) dehydratase
MSWAISEEIAMIFRAAEKEPLMPFAHRDRAPILDRSAIEAVLPHRAPFLFVDRVTALDLDRGLIAARYDLAQAKDVFAGHFPNRPIWPGVLQIEAIGQAGCLLYLKRVEASGHIGVTVTHILGARFIRPITPGGDMEVLAHGREDGLFFTIVGQCLQNGVICSIAAVTII